jgi:hypothetical protein
VEYPKETFKKLAQELKRMAIPPEIELIICFPQIEQQDCEGEISYPTVGAVLHQIKSLMEELQSFEGE